MSSNEKPKVKILRLGIDIDTTLGSNGEFELCMCRIQTIENINPTDCKSIKIVSCLINSMKNLENYNLISLDLYQNQITTIENISHMHNLELLDLSFNKIKKIEHLDELVSLKKLYLSSNEISKIEGLNTLVNLTCLELGSNRIKKIENFSNLINLEELWLGRNKIGSMYIDGYFEKLTKLSLQKNRITEWDERMFIACPNLVELYISECALKTIPKAIGKLKQLQILDLSMNKISDIENLAEAENIEEVWLNNNCIDELNKLESLTKLKNLRTRIKAIEYEISRTQKNKATEHHIGRLKAQLARYSGKLIEASKSSTHKGEGFEVERYGDARVVLIGYPSVGKSTLLQLLTGTKSETAAYEFTTLTCVPGIIYLHNAKIQLLDLPGIIQGASNGRGKGKQVISVARSADLILFVLDATKEDKQIDILEQELHNMGIRLNKEPPDIQVKTTNSGGIKLASTINLNHMTKKLCENILSIYKITNAEVLFRNDYDADDLIDHLENNRKYISCLYIYNKIDSLSIKQLDEIAYKPNTVCISSQKRWNINRLLDLLWIKLNLIRIYTKKQGEFPDFKQPLILSKRNGGFTVRNAIRLIHKELVNKAKFAYVWGRSVKHTPQQVCLDHILSDEDVIQVVT